MAIQSNFPAIKPSLNLDFSNTKRLDSRITFTRASTATYYDGVTTAKAEENLFFQSQDFTNATYWATNTASVSYTANTTVAPDGTTTADTMTAAVGTGTRFGSGTGIYGITSGLVYTASLFVQAGTDTVVQLLFPTSQFGANAYANFDLSAGTVGSVGASATATISSAGGTWYRCSITATATASSTGSIGVGFAFTGNNSSAARLPSIITVGTETLILWGAQLEQRSSVTSYTATTTQPITNYIPVLLTAANNQPRFDHNPTTDESLGLLIEEQRTNLLLQSEDLDTTWAETRATLNLNSVVSPAGTLTADRLIASTDNNTHFTTQTFTGTAASYTFTAYAKASGLNFVALRLFNGTSQVGLAYYNLSTGATGTVTAGTATITSVGNGWYRCSLTATLAASASCTADIYLASADNTNSFAGDAFNGIALWGFQTELGAFPTSYIKTVAATVTRSPDAASMIGPNFSNWYNQGQGTLFAEFSWIGLKSAAGQRVVVMDDGTTANYWGMIATSANGMQNPVVVNSVTEATNGTPATTYSANTYYKQIVALAFNSTVAAVNGVAGTDDTVVTMPVVSVLRIGASSAGVVSNIRFRRIAYYPLRLTNAQLQALTG